MIRRVRCRCALAEAAAAAIAHAVLARFDRVEHVPIDAVFAYTAIIVERDRAST